MLKDLTTLEDAFREISQTTKEKCGDKIEELRDFSFTLSHFVFTIKKYYELNIKNFKSKMAHSFVHICILELMRKCGHVLFLTCNGLYISAFINIRYFLESIIQAIYLDQRHSEQDIKTKMAILTEVEDKREYRVMRLIDEIKIGHKGDIRREYKKLSKLIHSSHIQFLTTMRDILEHDVYPTTIDCEKVFAIFDSMKTVFDISFFIFLTYFQELKKPLIENSDFIKYVKIYNLNLVSKSLKL